MTCLLPASDLAVGCSASSSLALPLWQALQSLVNIQRSLVDWYQVTTANAASATPPVAPAAVAEADADDQHVLESDPKPAPAGASKLVVACTRSQTLCNRRLRSPQCQHMPGSAPGQRLLVVES